MSALVFLDAEAAALHPPGVEVQVGEGGRDLPLERAEAVAFGRGIMAALSLAAIAYGTVAAVLGWWLLGACLLIPSSLILLRLDHVARRAGVVL